ncbi:hypothetical protein HPB50_021231 [Hyalomma asiaticum]|uniref:Uncharacterized protein n=1 Tax=Hyalomma asiaticum TaxID=266040 RepID=A0ACB7RY21_HYAAI|nr:hypothetical protein HPB50_021231 [Hyalomma asiaticum]
MRIGKKVTGEMYVCSEHFKQEDYFWSHLGDVPKTAALRLCRTSETVLEDIVTRESSRMHHPMLHLAFGCTCLTGLIVAFAVGLVLLVLKEASGMVDKYSIDLISKEVREALDKSDYAWPFAKYPNANKMDDSVSYKYGNY